MGWFLGRTDDGGRKGLNRGSAYLLRIVSSVESTLVSAVGDIRWTGWFGRLSLLAVLVFIAPLALHSLSNLGLQGYADDLLAETRKRIVPRLEDATGRELGVMPRRYFGQRGIVHEAVPRSFARMYWACEDERANSYFAQAGVDPVAILSSVAQTLLTGQLRGASGVYMQAARTMRSSAAGNWSAKLRQILDAVALAPRLTTREALELMVANHDFLDRVPGRHSGLGFASRTLFGQAPASLFPEEAAILVAAVRRPFRFGDQARWDNLRKRARHCLRKSGYDAPLVMRRLSNLGAPEVGAARRNSPVRIAGAGTAAVLSDASFEALLSGHGNDTQLLFNLSGKRQKACDLSVRRAQKRGALARFKFAEPWHDVGGAELLIAVRDETGLQCLLSYGTQAGRFHGAAPAWSGGGFDSAQDPFPLASTAKIIGLLHLSDRANLRERWCPEVAFAKDGKPLKAGKDLGVSDCDRAQDRYLAVQEAMAISHNLAFNWRLRRSDQADLAGLIDRLGFSTPDDINPAYAVSFGQVHASPAQLLALMDAVAECVQGKPGGWMPASLLAVDDASATTALQRQVRAVVREICDSDSARLFLRRTLEAPVLGKKGTARATVFKPGRMALDFSLRKTGTHDLENGQTKVVWLTGSVVRGAKRYSFVARLGSGRGGGSLGRRNLYGANLTAVADAALCAVSGFECRPK
ncbi:transglycosylase domain-containing protein [Pelagibius sp. Alg239-R121]|uniref:transglycosylase domain-containing protein n=1 Tax=Pelagibius sp. Alg239-R121 TaxID=2993448 RepID=UPI0024A77929|nr:transglycosylase domain-containing protein [Pelagibius sp. Alg239-R121]